VGSRGRPVDQGEGEGGWKAFSLQGEGGGRDIPEETSKGVEKLGEDAPGSASYV